MLFVICLIISPFADITIQPKTFWQKRNLYVPKSFLLSMEWSFIQQRVLIYTRSTKNNELQMSTWQASIHSFPLPVSSYALNHHVEQWRIQQAFATFYPTLWVTEKDTNMLLCSSSLRVLQGHERRKITAHIVYTLTLFRKQLPDSWLLLHYCYLLK